MPRTPRTSSNMAMVGSSRCACCGDYLAGLAGLFSKGQSLRHSAGTLQCDEEDVMDPFVRIRSDASLGTRSCDRGTKRRPSADMMALHYVTNSVPLDARMSMGPPVTSKNIKEGMYVKRGPNWKWGTEDGCDERPGIIIYVDREAATANVLWSTGNAYGHYRFGKQYDLSEYRFKDDGCASESSSMSMFSAARRNSQPMFAMKNQTAVVLDWDDTLFPSTFLRYTLRLSPRLPLGQQRMTPIQKRYAESVFEDCAKRVLELLACIEDKGQVVIVTLARKPWVTDSCAHFYPGVGELLRELGVKIIYAQEPLTASPQVLTKGMSDEQLSAFWSKVKGQAISNALKEVHTLYEGQSWKNVISIGDSEFERVGTKGAVREYSHDHGISLDSSPQSKTPCQEIGGHVYKVRTKTIKMLDGPSAEELMVQMQMLQRWFPYLVHHDGNFDADLNDLNDTSCISDIESRLNIN